MFIERKNSILTYFQLDENWCDVFGREYDIGKEYEFYDNIGGAVTYFFPQDFLFSNNDKFNYAIAEIWGDIIPPNFRMYCPNTYVRQKIVSTNIKLIRKIDADELFSKEEFYYKLKWFKSYEKYLVKEYNSNNLTRIRFPSIEKNSILSDGIGLVNTDGVVVTDRFKCIYPFSDGYATVETLDNKYNFIDINGNKICKTRDFDDIVSGFYRYDGINLCAKIDKHLYLTTKGEIIKIQ